mmetsp:Transcript_35440/g.140911  ORF Transcript_35440/g.140911 Transcript_35440/m.140911 type:complete len:108 (-) Transcript_35440:2209-2532(-)
MAPVQASQLYLKSNRLNTSTLESQDDSLGWSHACAKGFDEQETATHVVNLLPFRLLCCPNMTISDLTGCSRSVAESVRSGCGSTILIELFRGAFETSGSALAVVSSS